MPDLHADAHALATEWVPFNHPQESIRQAFLALLEARDDACRRTCVPGHITASALVLNDAQTHILLTLHPRTNTWVQVGGHLEDDATVLAAAQREALEETGIGDLLFDPEPLRLSIHAFTCRNSPPTRHFDVTFVAWAPPGSRPQISDESLDLAWWPLDSVPNQSPDFLEAVDRARERRRPSP